MGHEQRLTEREGMSRRLLALGLAATVLLALASPVGATNPDRVTRGDVESHFQAAEAGGAIVSMLGTPASTTAAPAFVLTNGIRPFVGSPWDGASFCEDDWHLLVIANLAAVEDEPIAHDLGSRFLASSTTELTLDGTVIAETERTAIKHFPGGIAVDDLGNIFEVQEGWFDQTGAFYAPGELSVGPHTFEATAVTPFFTFKAGPITFYIDESGTGVCA